MRARSFSPLALVTLFAVALSGCPGRLENPEDFVGATSDGAAPTCTLGVSAVEAQLIRPRCATANCHDRAGRAGGLDLETPGLAARLVNARSAMCSGRVLVDPASPTTGYFIEKLSPSPRCGGRMPLGAPALTSGELTCVRAWVSTLGVDAGMPLDVPRDTGTDATVDARDVAADMASDIVVDARPMDASDVTDASDASGGSDVVDSADASDAGETIDAAEVGPDVRDVPDAGDAAADASVDVRDVPASDVRDVPASDVRDVPASDVRDVPDAGDASDAPDADDAPDA
jgi:hypothetical protein